MLRVLLSPASLAESDVKKGPQTYTSGVYFWPMLWLPSTHRELHSLQSCPHPAITSKAAPFPGEDNEMQSCISKTGQWRNWLSPQNAKESNDLLVFISLQWTDGISRRVALSQCILQFREEFAIFSGGFPRPCISQRCPASCAATSSPYVPTI